MRLRPAALACLAILFAAQISAQSPNLPNKTGFYIAGAGHYSTLDGNFDGQTFFYTSAEAIIVPKLEPGFGAGGILGYRGSMWALEATGYYKPLSSSFGGTHYDTSILGFAFDFELLFFTAGPVQPYLTAGLGFSTITVAGGSINSSSVVGDAIYYTGGLRAGLGIELCMTNRLFIRAQGIYRIDKVNSAKGVNGDELTLPFALDAYGYDASVIIGYIL
jgi:hypothetical protein